MYGRSNMARRFMVTSTWRTSLLPLVVVLYCLVLYKTNTYSVECFSNNEAVLRSSSSSSNRSSTYGPPRQQISMLKSNKRQGLLQDQPTTASSSSYFSLSSRTTQWMSPADNDSSSDINQELTEDRITDKVLTTATTLKEEAEMLKQQADQLRKEINASSSSSTPTTTDTSTNTSPTATTKSSSSSSPWDIVRSFSSSSSFVEGGDEDDPIEGEEYRLYVDIGREDGTWMDPRWGASGKRIEFTIDVRLLPDRSLAVVSDGSSSDMDFKDLDDNNEALADPQLVLEKFENAMVKDNTLGQSSEVYPLEAAQYARLRNGFDRMECSGGAYRIDQSPRDGGRYTLRLVLEVEGTTKADQQYMYGDVSVPPGYLYFSLPCFGGSISQLSSKEGPVTVRQVGWHTGWRRQESRIVGVFRAKPLADAKRIDKY